MIINRRFTYIMLFTIPLLISGCEFIVDVFKTGVWAGVIIIIAIAAVIAFIVKLFSK